MTGRRHLVNLPEGYGLRPGADEDIAALQRVDLAASRLFDGTGLIDEPDGPVPVPEDALRAGITTKLLYVVTSPFGEPVGFALCRVVAHDLYLDQISVDPSHGGRGLGAYMVQAIIEEANDRHLRGVILSTFRDLPWNGPFYAKHGFVELPRSAMKGWMKSLEAIQAQTMDVSLRCFMRRPGKWDRHWLRPKAKSKLEVARLQE